MKLFQEICYDNILQAVVHNNLDIGFDVAYIYNEPKLFEHMFQKYEENPEGFEDYLTSFFENDEDIKFQYINFDMILHISEDEKEAFKNVEGDTYGEKVQTLLSYEFKENIEIPNIPRKTKVKIVTNYTIYNKIMDLKMNSSINATLLYLLYNSF